MNLPAELRAGLSVFPRELETAMRSFPVRLLDWKPASWGGCPGETFSVREHACHVRDIEKDGYHVRLRRLIEEQDPSLASIDGYEMATERRYADADLGDALRAFKDARGATLAMVDALSREDLARSGDFVEYDRINVLGLLHYLRSHDLQHLACLQWLQGRMASAGVSAG